MLRIWFRGVWNLILLKSQTSWAEQGHTWDFLWISPMKYEPWYLGIPKVFRFNLILIDKRLLRYSLECIWVVFHCLSSFKLFVDPEIFHFNILMLSSTGSHLYVKQYSFIVWSPQLKFKIWGVVDEIFHFNYSSFQTIFNLVPSA